MNIKSKFEIGDTAYFFKGLIITKCTIIEIKLEGKSDGRNIRTSVTYSIEDFEEIHSGYTERGLYKTKEEAVNYWLSINNIERLKELK